MLCHVLITVNSRLDIHSLMYTFYQIYTYFLKTMCTFALVCYLHYSAYIIYILHRKQCMYVCISLFSMLYYIYYTQESVLHISLLYMLYYIGSCMFYQELFYCLLKYKFIYNHTQYLLMQVLKDGFNNVYSCIYTLQLIRTQGLKPGVYPDAS